MRPALALAAAMLVAGCHGTATSRDAEEIGADVVALVLGTAQDGGLPQATCHCDRCDRARRDPAFRRRVACLGLVDRREGKAFLVDATPDFREQVERLQSELPDRSWGRNPVDGICLTHAHVGHYVGLVALGRETMGSRGVPLFASQRMTEFLARNAPFELLVRLGNVELHAVLPETALRLTPRLTARAHRVPHRDEYTDTFAWEIEGPSRRLLWLPDIDRLEAWPELDATLARVDVAYVDGTFFSGDELPGRDLREVPHPRIEESAALLQSKRVGRNPDVRYVHLNHSNPAVDPESAASRWIENQGLRVAAEGERIRL
ncbi:MAG: MBL fold metallo-hydrolase [Planctomycetes bacterium]|nr:MBL fold metallo-hydrolase [Planctomycetota bacterium]